VNEIEKQIPLGSQMVMMQNLGGDSSLFVVKRRTT